MIYLYVREVYYVTTSFLTQLRPLGSIAYIACSTQKVSNLFCPQDAFFVEI